MEEIDKEDEKKEKLLPKKDVIVRDLGALISCYKFSVDWIK